MTSGTSPVDVALRLDDVGAASKRWEVYARRLPLPGRAAHIGDLLFLKYLPPLAAWGPYRELSAAEWEAICRLLEEKRAVLTVAVTAAWVTWSGELVPFHQRFPGQAAVLERAASAGIIEIANHGLTHCVLEGHAFRPKLWGGNRAAHREFWPSVPEEEQFRHIKRAQEILAAALGVQVVTLVPPGNVFGPATLRAAYRCGLRYLSCATPGRTENGIRIIDDRSVVAFHDRDIVRHGVAWLARLIDRHQRGGRRFRRVRELGGENGRAAPGARWSG